MKKLFFILLFPIQLVVAQPEIQLDSCYLLARENYPNLKQSELWKEITRLKIENSETAYLPQLKLNGQITYQSAVTELPISIPGVNISSVSKDRYNAYAELQQTIWDGGITKSSRAIEDAILKSNLSQVEVELYKLNEQVARAFFTVLITDQQSEVIDAQIETINEQLKLVNSAIKNGAKERSAALVLEAEILNLEQNLVELNAARRTALQMLGILTGESISEQSGFKYKKPATNFNSEFLRPELQLFANQRNKLGTQQDLLTKKRNPKLFGFGQVGYGKPGLNMLQNDFKGYYLLGVGVSWNAFDWKNTTRQKQILQLQQQMLQSQEETFIQNLEILLVQQKEQISKIENLLNKDKKMVTLRADIAKAAASKLENETITTSDYIREVQSETIAKLNLQLHQIQLNEAQEKYTLIKGR